MALKANAIMTVPEAEEFLELKGSGKQSLLERHINAISTRMEREINDFLIVRAHTEDRTGGPTGIKRGGSKRIYLDKTVSTVTSITDDDSVTVAATEYTIVAPNVLEHDSSWPRPTGRWTIAYQAGRFAAISNVEDDIKEQGADWISFLMRRAQPGVKRKKVGGLEIEYTDTVGGIPSGIRDFLRSLRRHDF